jgi:hypothetical protein
MNLEAIITVDPLRLGELKVIFNNQTLLFYRQKDIVIRNHMRRSFPLDTVRKDS